MDDEQTLGWMWVESPDEVDAAATVLLRFCRRSGMAFQGFEFRKANPGEFFS